MTKKANSSNKSSASPEPLLINFSKGGQESDLNLSNIEPRKVTERLKLNLKGDFRCGHPRLDVVTRKKKYFLKKVQRYTILIDYACRICHYRYTYKRNEKKRVTNRRWKLVNGRRFYYKEQGMLAE